MAIAQRTDDRGCDGLQEGEQRAEGAAEEDDVIARAYGAGEGVLVGVQGAEDAC